MSTVVDFRHSSRFEVKRVNENGRFMGRTAYWRLYFIENTLRVVINTVLSIQVDPRPYPTWWEYLYHGTTLMRDADRARRQYLGSSPHTYPGRHGIYYVYLRDLGTIMHDNSVYFEPIMPEVDEWVLKIESVRLPRNCVGHMNLINAEDRHQINRLYYDCKGLIRKLQKVEVGPEKLVLQIPAV